MSSRELLEQSEKLEPLIRTLLNDPPFVKRASSRQLGTSLGLWYVTLRRAADSGMAAWRAFDRSHMPGRRSKRDPLARWEAMLDYSSVFAVGGMVLEDLAYCELERRTALPTGRRAQYWPALIKHIEGLADDPFRSDAIYLDLTLYEGRNRLVMHRTVGQWELHGFGNSGDVRLSRVVLPGERDAADDLIREAAAAYGPAPHGIDIDSLADRLVAVSSRLPADARKKIKDAYLLGGFTPPPLPRLTERAIGLVQFIVHTAAGARLSGPV